MEIDMQFFKDFLLLFFIAISLIIGVKIISKYREEKEKVLITVGLTWIFITSSWWNDVIFFFIRTLRGITESDQEYHLISSLTEPCVSIAILCWMYSFCMMKRSKWTKEVVLSYLPFSIAHLIAVILEHYGPADLYFFFSLISNMILLFFIISAITTGYFFFKQTKRSEKSKVRWKGRFLLLAFISFTIGSFLEVIIDMRYLFYDAQVIARIILISSAIEYYLGFFIPERLLGRLMKKKIYLIQ